MATRSTISLKNGNQIETIYCHWDGYIAHNGYLLQTYFNTTEKAIELLKLGDLSSLSKELYPAKGVHTFDKPQKGVTVAYGRDRGEKDTFAKAYFFRTPQNKLEEYNYIYSVATGKWCVLIDGKKYSLAKLVRELHAKDIRV